MSRHRHPRSSAREHEPCDAVSEQARRALFRGLGVGIDDFRCRARVAPEGEEEPNPTNSIVFVRRGVFVRGDGDQTIVADANQILFFNRGQPYRYAHPISGGDDCTILMLEDDCVRGVVARLTPGHVDHPARLLRIGHAQSTHQTARLHIELLAACRDPDRQPAMVCEDLVAELIDAALAALLSAGTGSSGLHDSGPRAQRWREVVEAVKLVLNERFESPPNLAELAATVSCSPFHLSRVFRAVTGLTLRRYLRRLRTRLASDALARDARDLTALALDLGFCDHSHFTNSFRDEFGMPPSRIRKTPADVGQRAGQREQRGSRTASGPQSFRSR